MTETCPAVPELPPTPALGGGWALHPAEPSGRTTRICAVAYGGEPVGALRLRRVLGGPLGGCYPAGARDLSVELLDGQVAEGAGRAAAGQLIRRLVPALFAADPRCRRIVAAPDEDDAAAVGVYEAGGFRRIAESDLADGRSVLLLATEPAALRELPTALDDMPH